MGRILRLLLVVGMAAVGLLLAIEIQAHRRPRGERRPRSEASAEVQQALLETAATTSPGPSAAVPRGPTAPTPPAPRSTASGTTPLGVVAALAVVALTGWLLYRLSG